MLCNLGDLNSTTKRVTLITLVRLHISFLDLIFIEGSPHIFMTMLIHQHSTTKTGSSDKVNMFAYDQEPYPSKCIDTEAP